MPENSGDGEPNLGSGESSATRSRVTGQQQANSTTDPNVNSPGWDAVIAHIKSHKIDLVLAFTRTLTVLFTVSYLIGFPGPSQRSFNRALISAAATSSFRLHQRIPPPPWSQFNRSYIENLFKEDSFHYFIFPFMFFFGQPLTLVLLPCALYALFNLAVYALTILEKLGNQEPLRQCISNLVLKHQKGLLHTIALSEIVLMPSVAIGVFTRVVNISVPFMYYRFLKLRYNSERNPHLKILVSQIKTVATTYASRYMNR